MQTIVHPLGSIVLGILAGLMADEREDAAADCWKDAMSLGLLKVSREDNTEEILVVALLLRDLVRRIMRVKADRLESTSFPRPLRPPITDRYR
jgi:hypothetical protein